MKMLEIALHAFQHGSLRRFCHAYNKHLSCFLILSYRRHSLLVNSAISFCLDKMSEDKSTKQQHEWLKRFEKRFDALAGDKPFVTLEDILEWPARMKGELSNEVDLELLEKFRASLIQFWQGAGILPGKKVTKTEFVEGLKALAEADLRRKRSGEETIYENLHNALFDVTDVNKDGTLSLDEVKIMMKTFKGMDQPGAAASLFKMADKNKNGKVTRKELIELKFNFWFNPGDTTAKGLFAGAFE